jgi:hypothetical protein
MYPCQSFKLFISSMTEFEVTSFKKARSESKKACLEHMMKSRGIESVKLLEQNCIDEIQQEIEKLPSSDTQPDFKTFLARKSLSPCKMSRLSPEKALHRECSGLLTNRQESNSLHA